MNLDAIHASILDHRHKGIPGGTEAFRLDAIGAKGWNLLRADMNFPIAVLKDSALAHNGAWMRDFLKRSGAVIAPPNKSSNLTRTSARDRTGDHRARGSGASSWAYAEV